MEGERGVDVEVEGCGWCDMGFEKDRERSEVGVESSTAGEAPGA